VLGVDAMTIPARAALASPALLDRPGFSAFCCQAGIASAGKSE